jgi:putative Mg2+ transporter-C (MgtC) family protein
MTSNAFILRLFTALLAGLLIGFERQWQHKSAGLRTNTLVSVGAAIFVLLSTLITQDGAGDTTRIIGQVVTGIGFLCAGIIFKEGLSVHGLTTAVTVWCCSAVGCLAAAGFFKETFIATAFVISVNLILKPVDDWLIKRNGNGQ